MSIAISMVTLSEEQNLSVADFLNFFSNSWPEHSPISISNQDESIKSFRIDGCDVIVAPMPAPIPWNDLEHPCKTSILWPDSTAALKQHKAHVIVTVHGESDPVSTSSLLTKATASVLAGIRNSNGVYWGNSESVIRKDIFIDFAVNMLPENPPLFVWLKILTGNNEKSLTSAYTVGMSALGHFELETQSSNQTPKETRERFESLAYYLIENGAVIKDGDTVGEDQNERIRVILSESSFGHKGQVMNVVYEKRAPKKSWRQIC